MSSNPTTGARIGRTVETFKQLLVENLYHSHGQPVQTATKHDAYMALCYTVRDHLIANIHQLCRRIRRCKNPNPQALELRYVGEIQPIVRLYEDPVLGAKVWRGEAYPFLPFGVAANDHHAIGVAALHKLLGAPPGVDIVAALDLRLGANGSDNVSTGACDLLILAIDERREFEGHETNLVG